MAFLLVNEVNRIIKANNEALCYYPRMRQRYLFCGSILSVQACRNTCKTNAQRFAYWTKQPTYFRKELHYVFLCYLKNINIFVGTLEPTALHNN